MLDPRERPNAWLRSVLLDCLEDQDSESKAMLQYAIDQLSQWIEPGLIDSLFHPWIVQYLELLDESEKNQSSASQECLLEDHQD